MIPEKFGKLSIYKEDKKFRILFLFLLMFLAASIFSSIYTKKNEQPTPIENESIDTLIPSGFTLVPIELQNAESISPLFENFAIVNLYSNGGFGSNSNSMVGSNVKLLRAPLNPEKFAALVPEAKAGQIIANQLPLFAVILSRTKNEKANILERKKGRKINVEYYQEVKK